MKLTLHVGLPKTATTTIQHVLETQKAAMIDRGVLYPGTTAFQLDLVRRTQFDRSGVSMAEGTLGEAVGRVAAEVREVRPRHLVLSCEHMILVPTRAMLRLREAVETWLPEVREIAVLCYVREPIGFATSLCQQRLKSGTTRLADFAAEPWPFNLGELLGKLAKAHGRSAIELRQLHPDHLIGGTVVSDVLAAIGLPDLPLRDPVPVLNPSLSQHGALVADALAGLMPRAARSGGRNPALKRRLEAIPGPRFVLPEAVQRRIVVDSGPDLDAIRRDFGLNIVPQPVPQPEPDGFDAVMALAMAEDILRSLSDR